VHHGPPLDFQKLCRSAVPSTTRYLVFDLDRTLHLARNMGELLGWETSAYHAYGPRHLETVECERGAGRFLFAPSRPLATARYLYRGARSWAYPGLFYLLWGRMAGSTALTRRIRARRFGADAYLTVQNMPRLALLHDLAGMTLADARKLAASVFRRQADDQAIDRDDIDWLRTHCPGVQIILSSASPQPVVEAAAQELGIDAVMFSETEVRNGRISGPFNMSAVFLHEQQPDWISPPSRSRVNSGPVKVQRLVEAFPDILDAETVGITDTWHGDDHCWAQNFARVIDVNSISPFPPLVAIDSPVREIHSAQVLTRRERDARRAGETNYVSPQRDRLSKESACTLDATSIIERVAGAAEAADRLARRHEKLRDQIADEIGAVDTEAAQLLDLIEEAVARYNDAVPAARARYLRSLNRLVRKHERACHRRARVEAPLAEIALELSSALDLARVRVTGSPRPVSAPLPQRASAPV